MSASRTESELTAIIDALVARGKRRMAKATEEMRALHPAAIYWMTEEERSELHRWQMSMLAFRESTRSIKVRVKQKRALRRRCI